MKRFGIEFGTVFESADAALARRKAKIKQVRDRERIVEGHLGQILQGKDHTPFDDPDFQVWGRQKGLVLIALDELGGNREAGTPPAPLQLRRTIIVNGQPLLTFPDGIFSREAPVTRQQVNS